MTHASLPVSTEYLFARVHGMRAKAFYGLMLKELANVDGLEQLLHILQSHGIVSDNGTDFAKMLQCRELDILDRMLFQLPAPLGNFYHAFMARVFYRNIKTLLRFRYFKKNEETIRSLIVPLPFGAEIDLDRIFHAESMEDFISELHLDEETPGVEECIQRLSKTKDIIVAESELERLAYAKLLAAARQLPRAIREAAVSLVREEIDIQNICMLLRNIRTTHWSIERMALLWLADGEALSEKLLTALTLCQSVNEAVEGLPYAYRKTIEPVMGEDLPSLEHTVWSISYAHAKKLHRSSEDIRLPMVAFPFLLHFEGIDLGRVHECIRFGLKPQETTELLFGLN